jgi:hypothetical protein
MAAAFLGVMSAGLTRLEVKSLKAELDWRKKSGMALA